MKYLIWIPQVSSILDEVINALKGEKIDVDVLLLQDGVYMADKGNPASELLKNMEVGIYALGVHVEERGIDKRLIEGVNVVDYKSMVDLMMEKVDKVISL